MKVLFLGDVVGKLGNEMVTEYLPKLKKKYKPQVTIVNGENIASGKGITEKDFKDLMQAGVDVVTMGNHTWDNRSIFEFIDDTPHLLRPANYPDDNATPGKGIVYVKVNQKELAIISLHGRAFMGDLDSPFQVGEELVKEASKRTPFIFIDFHAESTSEKEAMGWFMDGRVSSVVGTHTHVQTNDHRILPKGTGYMSDVGMTGFYDGILGMNKEPILKKFLTQMPSRFSVPNEGRKRLNGVYLDYHPETGKTKKIKTIRIDSDNRFFD